MCFKIYFQERKKNSYTNIIQIKRKKILPAGRLVATYGRTEEQQLLLAAAIAAATTTTAATLSANDDHGAVMILRQ